MCAINGCNFEDRALIEAMNAETRHRGPDGTGIAVFGACTLGQDRLSIIDLSEAAGQPMWNANRTRCIIFNGEIYNFHDLKKSLESRVTFRTKSDTEVLLAWFEAHGIEGLKDLNGIFAFAIWDTTTQTLTLARDGVGVKPLYYHWDGRRIIFSSEIKGLLKAVPAALDCEAFSLMLALAYTPSPITMFKGIRKLEPGHVAIVKGGTLDIRRFWSDAPERHLTNRSEARRSVRALTEDSAKLQLFSDRPVGIFLSGGIDSTALAALTAKAGAGRIRSYTTRFSVPGMDDARYNSDADVAARTAARMGYEHHEMVITARDVIDTLDASVRHLDEPMGNVTNQTMYLLAREASKNIKVALCGDGPDELFGGYNRYDRARLVLFARMLPLGLRKRAAQLLKGLVPQPHLDKLLINTDVDTYLAFWSAKDVAESSVLKPNIFDATIARRFFSEKYFSGASPEDTLNYMMTVDRRTWLVDDALMRSDKMFAAHGVEGRVPFLDPRLVQLANGIPSSMKLQPLWQRIAQGKRIFIEAHRDLLPDEVLKKHKTGWYTPVGKYMRDPYVAGIVRDRLGALPPELFDVQKALELFERHKSAKEFHAQTLWNLITFQSWFETFKPTL